MMRRFQILLTLLAWCCLVSPWQSCLSDCREGALQPVGHGCHPEAEKTSACHCAHHEVAQDDATQDDATQDDATQDDAAQHAAAQHAAAQHAAAQEDVTDEDEDPGDPAEGENADADQHSCEGSAHASIVFQQAEPEPEVGFDPPAPTPVAWSAWASRRLRPVLREVLKPLEPPCIEPQRLRQLRIDVLRI